MVKSIRYISIYKSFTILYKSGVYKITSSKNHLFVLSYGNIIYMINKNSFIVEKEFPGCHIYYIDCNESLKMEVLKLLESIKPMKLICKDLFELILSYI